MIKIVGLLICLGFLISCSSQPTSEETTAETSCSSGDCSKNMEKLAGALTEQPSKPAPTHKKRHSKKK